MTHKIIVEMDRCDNAYSALESLTEASVQFKLLNDNVDDNIEFFKQFVSHIRKYYKQFVSLHCFLIDLANSI